MKAIALTHYLPSDHPHCFIETELPDPTPGPRDLLVRVKATSINPVDTKVRAPKAKVEATPRVLGWDAVGEVVAVGHEVTLFASAEAQTRARRGTESGMPATSAAPAATAPCNWWMSASPPSPPRP